MMTIIYTFVRYISSKESIYIAYSLMQMFSLGYVILYSQIFAVNTILQDIAYVFSSCCALVFALSFYEGKIFPIVKSTKELIILTILSNIVIVTSIYHYLLF